MSKFASLRKRAEEVLKVSTDSIPKTQDVEFLHLLHELDTYRIELELQHNELHEANAQLHETHKQLQKIHYRHYEIAPIGYITLDQKNLILEVNQTLASMLGLTKKQLLNHFFTDFIQQSDQDIFYFCHQALINSKTFQSCELRLNHLSRADFWVKLDCLFEQVNQDPQFHIAISDISHLKALEKNLLLDASVFDECTEAIMVTDPMLRIIKINNTFTEVTGYTTEEVLGKSPNILKSGKHDRRFYQIIWEKINNEGVWKGEIWNRRKNGEIYPEWMSITAVKNSENEVLHYIGVFSDINQLKISIQALENSELELRNQKDILFYQANHDHLTQLPNRLLLMDRLRQTIKKSYRHKSKVATLFIDLDHFKEINDSLGHNVGDEILKESAIRLKLCVRDSDTVSRLGGDEFIIILDELRDNDIIIDIATKINTIFQKPFVVLDHKLYVTSSIGISLYPSDAETAEELLRNADAAMYKAKEDDRNTYRFYTEDMTQKALKRIQMESHLRHALEHNELTVYYQPQVNAKTGQIIGMEALVRWQHPQQGLIPPDRFIPLAEKTGLIIPLGEQVFDIASQQMACWKKDYNISGRLAINLSVKQFQQKNIIEILSDKLKDNHCKAQWIELEITENYVMDNPQQAIDTLEELQAMGFQIAIDDFGTGYSSLSYLRRLPVNKLKIDRSFVRDMMDNEYDKVIITSTIALAKSMRLNVIAEGVETREQKDFILEQGCEIIQGYYYSRPVPDNKMSQLLSSTDGKWL